jgi:hypothetical protein
VEDEEVLEGEDVIAAGEDPHPATPHARPVAPSRPRTRSLRLHKRPRLRAYVQHQVSLTVIIIIFITITIIRCVRTESIFDDLGEGLLAAEDIHGAPVNDRRVMISVSTQRTRVSRKRFGSRRVASSRVAGDEGATNESGGKAPVFGDDALGLDLAPLTVEKVELVQVVALEPVLHAYVHHG